MTKPYAAHIRDDGTVQTIREHLEGTAELAKRFGDGFGSGEYAWICGLLHDIGKFSLQFQNRIYEKGPKTDHSTAGAVEVNRQMKTIGHLLAYCIAGHHTGLPDGGTLASMAGDATLCGRLQKPLPDYSCFHREVSIPFQTPPPPIHPMGNGGFSLSFYVRMLFSCLVDADFLDTERFMSPNVCRGEFADIPTLREKLDDHIQAFAAPKTDINHKRTEILNRCLDKAQSPQGLFTLTVPTGGGKTISSLAFALKHAEKHGMDRIIYVIPYNSIIEQNAAVFKTILGEDNVLEHHSNFCYDDEKEQMETYRLATENWDMPVIVTTTVQFFESLFSNRTSKCRKLHNIANSVVIFDEAQMLPVPFLRPCVQGIAELVHNYRSTAVLCSATQPTLDRMFPPEIQAVEICENRKEMYGFFRRTTFISLGEIDDEVLATRLNDEHQVLCIVNLRKQAQNLFRLLKEEGSFHLSTLMYPQHRKSILKEIRQRLKDGLPCRVVSTSLIEAGVDVDFPVVYRAEAGIDSLVQAAGRCNREWKRKTGPVYVFQPIEKYRTFLPDMLRRPNQIARSILQTYEDIASPEAITEYFSLLYKVTGEGLDINRIIDDFEAGLKNGGSFPFAEVASRFHLIDNCTYAVLIPRCQEAERLLLRLQNGERSRELLRRIQPYTVSVYENHYRALLGSGGIDALDDEIAVLLNTDLYSEKTGLDGNSDSGVGIIA